MGGRNLEAALTFSLPLLLVCVAIIFVCTKLLLSEGVALYLDASCKLAGMAVTNGPGAVVSTWRNNPNIIPMSASSACP